MIALMASLTSLPIVAEDLWFLGTDLVLIWCGLMIGIGLAGLLLSWALWR